MEEIKISPFYQDKLDEIKQLISISSSIDTSFKRIRISYKEDMRREFIDKIIVAIKGIIDKMGLNADG